MPVKFAGFFYHSINNRDLGTISYLGVLGTNSMYTLWKSSRSIKRDTGKRKLQDERVEHDKLMTNGLKCFSCHCSPCLLLYGFFKKLLSLEANK